MWRRSQTLLFGWRHLQAVRADGWGNNVAVECPTCLQYPVFLIACANQRGASADNPGECRHCRARIYIRDDVTKGVLHVLTLAVHPRPDKSFGVGFGEPATDSLNLSPTGLLQLGRVSVLPQIEGGKT